MKGFFRLPKAGFFIPFVAGIAVCFGSLALSLSAQTYPPVSVEIEGVKVSDLQSVEIRRKAPFLESRISMDGNVWKTERTVFSLLLVAPSKLLPEIKGIKIKAGEKKILLEGSRIMNSPGFKTAGNSFILPVRMGNFDLSGTLAPFAVSCAFYVVFVAVLCFLCRPFRGLAGTVAAFILCAAGILSANAAVLSAILLSAGFFCIVLTFLNLSVRPAGKLSGFNPANAVSANPLFAVFCAVCFFLCLKGVNWGIAEAWNPDQIAFKLNFNNFNRPHFVTYAHLLFSHFPAFAAQTLFDLPAPEKDRIVILISRILNLAAFVGCGFFVYAWTKKFAGAFPAALASAVLLFSPGYGTHSKFLTADIPLAFFMLAAFHFSLRIFETGRIRDYLTAGFFAGIAAGAKYNGIFVATAIAVVHFLRCRKTGERTVFNRGFVLAVLWTPLGMFVADPAILLNFREFASDVYVNFSVVRFYEGNIHGNSLGKFLAHSLELFGFFTVLVFVSNCLAFYFFLKNKIPLRARVLFVASWSVFIVYFAVIGFSPRLDVRYVLPAYVFLVPACAVLFSVLGRKSAVFAASAVLVYGSACLWIVGERFAGDPRMEAVRWVEDNARNSVLETSHYSPTWRAILGESYQTVKMPNINHNKMPVIQPFFERGSYVFTKIEEITQKRRKNSSFYSRERLELRDPDYVAINSIFVNQFTENSEVFPLIADYFEKLLGEKFKYRIVFDRENPVTVPWWAYPKGAGNVQSRMVILQRVRD